MNLSTRQQVKIKEVERDVGPTESYKTNNDSAASESQYPDSINSNIDRYHFANDKLIEMSLLKDGFLNVKKERGESIANSEMQDSSLKDAEELDNNSSKSPNKVRRLTQRNNQINNNVDLLRVLRATQQVIEIHPRDNFGNKLIGIKFIKRYSFIFKDKFGVFGLVAFLGGLTSFLSVIRVLPEHFAFCNVFGLPSLMIVFLKMNCKLLSIVIVQYFTLLKTIYLIIFVYCGICISGTWSGYCGFIVCGLQFLILGVFCDCFHLASRIQNMKKVSVFMFFILLILFIFLHLGLFDISKVKIDVFGFCNLSLSNLFGSSLSSLLVFAIFSIYVAFWVPNRIVTFHSPITTEKMNETEARVLKSMPSISALDLVFPSVINTLDKRLEFVIQKEMLWKAEIEKYFNLLNVNETKEIRVKERRKTQIMEANLSALMASSDEVDEDEVTFILQAKFKPVVIDPKNTIGRALKLEKLSNFIGKSGFGAMFMVMWLVGAFFSYIAMNHFIPSHYILLVLITLPSLTNFLMYNVPIIKLLIFSFETFLILSYLSILCICGCILVRNEEYFLLYTIFFINYWISFTGIIMCDALPGKTRGLNAIIGGFIAVLTSFAMLINVYFDWLQMEDFIIPLFGNISMGVASLYTTAAVNLIVFSMKNLIMAFLHPSNLVILQGDLLLIEVTQSQLRVMQEVNEIIQHKDFTKEIV